MRPPSQLTYNDLNGKEATDLLVNWFKQLLEAQPLLQPHLTLPMAKFSLDLVITVDMHVGGTVPVASPPDTLKIPGSFKLYNDVSAAGSATDANRYVSDAEHTAYVERTLAVDSERSEQHLSAVVNAAPIPGGSPPDQIREQHGLPVPRPGYGDRETGRHLFIGDIEVRVDPYHKDDPVVLPDVPVVAGVRKGIVADGYVFATESPSQPDRQSIDLANGSIEVDLSGKGISHAGMVVKDDTHRKSVKEFGDSKGERYSSVNGVYDAGPAGLMNNRGSGGLYSDGRQRISFGNNKPMPAKAK